MLEGLVNIEDGPVGSYPNYSQPDGKCTLGFDQFLVEIKCPFSGYIPKTPSHEYLVQCQAHMNAHEVEKTLLIFYTPTCLVIFIVYRNVRLWNMLSGASKAVMDYISKRNLYLMGYGSKPMENNIPDMGIISSAITGLSQYHVILEYEEGGDLIYDKNFFQELTIPAIQDRISIKNL